MFQTKFRAVLVYANPPSEAAFIDEFVQVLDDCIHEWPHVALLTEQGVQKIWVSKRVEDHVDAVSYTHLTLPTKVIV